MRYWLVMPAAGIGSRFGQGVPKQYVTLHGRAVVEWSLAPFLADSRCAGIAVALAATDPFWPAVSARITSTHSHRASKAGVASARAPIVTTTGGSHRSESVRLGLAALAGCAEANDWVLVHDAARPCVSSADVDRLLSHLDDDPIGGLLAAPATDTLKAEGESSRVARTVDRSRLWRALTPQMFRYRRLCEALDAAAAAGSVPTDESQAIEWLGDQPVLVEGSAANVKITCPDDLVVAAALLERLS